MIPMTECRISGTLTCKSSMGNDEYIEISNGECNILPAGKCKDSLNNLGIYNLQTDPDHCREKITNKCLDRSNGIC